MAVEEYLLKTCQEDCFMLWRNRKAIIVGRNQNTRAQINPDYVSRDDVSVVRRMSGGGAVFHDLGNVNYTFIRNRSQNGGIEFRRYMEPILGFLQQLDIPARFDGRNDLVLADRKISGNAQCVHRGKTLHHGTILFDVNLADLTDALTVDPVKYRDRAVDSIRKRVTNISEHLPYPLSVDEFMEQLRIHVLRTFGGRSAALLPSDLKDIDELARNKYRCWEWNFGGSPSYNFCKSTRTDGGTLDVHLDADAGVIREVRIFGDFFGVKDVAELEHALRGCRHDPQCIAEIVGGLALEDYIRNVSVDELVSSMF